MKHKIGTPLHKDLIPNALTIVRLCVTGIILFWNGCSCAFIFHRLALLKSLLHCYLDRMLMVVSNSLPWVKSDWKSTNKLSSLLAIPTGICLSVEYLWILLLLAYLLYCFMGEEVPHCKTESNGYLSSSDQQRQNSKSPPKDGRIHKDQYTHHLRHSGFCNPHY